MHTPAPNQKSTKPGKSQSRRLILFPYLSPDVSRIYHLIDVQKTRRDCFSKRGSLTLLFYTLIDEVSYLYKVVNFM